MKMSISDMPDDFYKGKRVLVRVDFNVPIEKKMVREDYRIRRSISTIEYLANRGAAIILASHLGRPKGKVVPKLSLKPVADRLSEVLRVRDVKFVDDCVGKNVKDIVNQLLGDQVLLLENLRFHKEEEANDTGFSKQLASLADMYVNDSFSTSHRNHASTYGQVLLLENLRFHKEEEANDTGFSKQLASLADMYVNDSFSTSHRNHASTYGIASFFKHRLAGFLVQKEIEVLSKIRDNPDRPFTVIVGGSKIKDKIGALKNLINKADRVLIGDRGGFLRLGKESHGSR